MSKLQVSARAVFFSEAHGEGDRAREKRVKSALRGASEREVEREWECHRGGRETGEGRFTAAGKRRSAGTHVESAKRSRSCVKCLDITVLFRPVRSSPFSPAFPQFHPFYSRPPEPTGRRRATLSLSAVPVRADLMTLPLRFDDDSIVHGQLKWSTYKLSFFTDGLSYPVLAGVFPTFETTDYWFNSGRYEKYELIFCLIVIS